MSPQTPLARALVMASLILAGEAIFGLPFALARVFRPTVLDVFGLTNLQLGAAFSLYGTVAMLSYFPGGPLADRYPARRMMSVALLSTALGDEGGGYCTVLEEHMLEAGAKSRAGSNAADPFWHALAGTKMAVASEVEKPINAAPMKKLAEPLGVPQATRDLYGGATQWRPMSTS